MARTVRAAAVLVLLAGVALAGCVETSSPPPQEDDGEETALEDSSTREQFTDDGDDGGDEGPGSLAPDLDTVSPGAVLGGLVGVVSLRYRGRR